MSSNTYGILKIIKLGHISSLELLVFSCVLMPLKERNLMTDEKITHKELLCRCYLIATLLYI